jgi:hypothetical protein
MALEVYSDWVLDGMGSLQRLGTGWHWKLTAGEYTKCETGSLEDGSEVKAQI